MTPFHYRVYGLHLASSVPIHGLTPTEAAAVDYYLRVAPVEMLPPDEAIVLDTSPLIEEGEPGTRVERSSLDPRTFVFEFRDGTRFRLDDAGGRITVHFPSTVEDMATYLLGPILAFIVRLRGALALHAGAVAIDGVAFVITGVAGAGKSTTTAAFLDRGAALLTDDVSVIDWDGDTPRVQSGYPRVRLWNDSAAALYGSAEALPLLTPTWSKRFVDARQKFASEPVPIGAIVVLAPRHEAPPNVRRLKGHEAAMALLARTSMTHLLDPSQRRNELGEVTRLVERIPVYEVTPRDDLHATGELLDTIAAAVL